MQPESTNPANANEQPYFLGLPMWSNKDWIGSLYPPGTNSQSYLKEYSSIFNTVEGNTTFYALPSVETVQSWLNQAQAGFRFCFKLPKTVTHSGKLSAGFELTEFFNRLQPLAAYLGPFMIQLPETVNKFALSEIKQFLQCLPDEFEYSIELRSQDFFKKDDTEKCLNQILMQHEVNRVCFDSRALFSVSAKTEAEKDAHKKKPNLPVHAIATGKNPIVRFIGTKDADYNQSYYQVWLAKLKQWVKEGRKPYFFVHTPANEVAPLHAQILHRQLNDLPGWKPLNKTVQQKDQLSIF